MKKMLEVFPPTPENPTTLHLVSCLKLQTKLRLFLPIAVTPLSETVENLELTGVGTKGGNPNELILVKDESGVYYIRKDKLMFEIFDYIKHYTGITVKNINVAETWGTASVRRTNREFGEVV